MTTTSVLERTRERQPTVEDVWATTLGCMLKHRDIAKSYSFQGKKFRRRFRIPYILFRDWLVPLCRERNIFGAASSHIPIEFKILAVRILGRNNTADDTDEGIRTNDRLEQCGLKFLFWLQECTSQAEHREGILKPFPDFDWEADFLAHISTLQNSEPSDTFVKSHKLLEGNMSEQKRKLIWFGSKVKTAFETARRLILVAANPLWIAPEKLPLGAMGLECSCLSGSGCGPHTERVNWPRQLSRALNSGQAKETILTILEHLQNLLVCT